MSTPIVLDLETQYSFREVDKDFRKLRVSVVGIYDYTREIFEAYEEKDLPSLFPILEGASLIIGYNIKKFDFEVLAPYYLGKLSQLPVLDLLEDIEKQLGFRLALDDLARESLGIKKTGHGFLAIEYFRSGQMTKLKEYCLADVRLTRDLYEFGKRERKVFFRDAKGRKEIAVNWHKPRHGAEVHLTLPL